MKTLLLIDQTALVQALGLTLVHSLWQGALLLAVLLLVWPKLRSARIRYLLAYTTLCSITLLAASTFVWVFEPANSVANQAPEPGYLPSFLPAIEASPVLKTTTFSPEPWYPLLVGLWVVGLVFFLLKLGGGMLYLGRMRRTALVVGDNSWQRRVDELAQQLSLSRPVLLLESALVHTPLTLGFLKPLILMPVGLINQLSASEVEAILAHELAHIARRDWLFNLFQAFMETLFYYHPAVWWLSDRIRAERENCCDDVAVALSGNPLMYAKTLVRLQEMARPTPILAPALHGTSFVLKHKRRPMLMRIKRILNPSQASHNTMEKIVATAILIVLIVLWTIRSGTDNFTSALKAMNPVEWVAGQVPGFGADFGNQTPANDTIPPKSKNTQKIVREDGDNRVEMELQNGEIKRLNIDGKDIPASDFNQYQTLVAELMEDATPPAPPAPPAFGFPPDAPDAPFVMAPQVRVTTETEGDNTVIKLDNGGNPMEIVVKDGQVWIDGKKMEEGESLNMPFENFNFPNGAVFYNNNQHTFWAPNPPDFPEVPNFTFSPGFLSGDFENMNEQERAAFEKEMQRVEKEMAAFEKEWSKEYDKMQKEQQKEFDRMQREQELYERQMQRMQLDMERDLQRATSEHMRAESEMVKAMEQQRHAERLSNVLKSELIKDGLIDKDNYSFNLSYKKLTINGEKQSDAVHQKYLRLYENISGKEMKKGDDIQMTD
ncbi:MAG: M48 family metalloprotease [Saprospiraceae bacterium]|nr:M48 family metalloprotease [Saprospiraceae bacterium]